MKRGKRRAVIALVISFVFWLGASGVIAWALTHRIRGPFAERVPTEMGFDIEEHRLVTSDGLHIGALARAATRTSRRSCSCTGCTGGGRTSCR